MQIAFLESEMQRVEEFCQRQAELEEIVFNYQNEKKLSEERFAREKEALEKNFVDQTRRLKEDFEHRLEQQRIATENAYDKCLDDRVKQIQFQNRRMAVELSLHKQVRVACSTTSETDLCRKRRRCIAKCVSWRLSEDVC